MIRRYVAPYGRQINTSIAQEAHGDHGDCVLRDRHGR